MQLNAYTPGMVHYDTPHHRAVDRYRFPAVSVTGTSCSLACDHCNRTLLSSMVPARTPEDLVLVAETVKAHKGTGLLVSGGADRCGRVPLLPYLDAMKEIKGMGLRLVVHTGLVDEDLAAGLASVGLDAALMDVVGDDETIRSVLHLDRCVGDYRRALELLDRHRVASVPHIVIGLHHGILRGEFAAVDLVASSDARAAVFVVLDPKPNTPMAAVKGVRSDDIAAVFRYAACRITGVPLALGCAKPYGPEKVAVETMAVDAGFSGMAFPAEDTVAYCESGGMTVTFSDSFCALIFRDR